MFWSCFDHTIEELVGKSAMVENMMYKSRIWDSPGLYPVAIVLLIAHE